MRRGLLGIALFLVGMALPAAQAPYYPPSGQWARKSPAEAGMDAAKLTEALELMNAHETASLARDFSDQEAVNGKLLASKWVPYTNAYVDIGGKRMTSIAGGTRWGGNIIFISPKHDLLVVWRRSAQSAEGFKRIVASVAS